jgi:hypothetical protein
MEMEIRMTRRQIRIIIMDLIRMEYALVER